MNAAQCASRADECHVVVGDKLADGLQKFGIRSAAAHQGAQVASGFAGKAGTQKALAGQAHPVAGRTEFAVHRRDEAHTALPAGHGVVHRRAVAEGSTGRRLQFRPAAGKALLIVFSWFADSPLCGILSIIGS